MSAHNTGSCFTTLFLKNEFKTEEYTDLLLPVIFRPSLNIQFS